MNNQPPARRDDSQKKMVHMMNSRGSIDRSISIKKKKKKKKEGSIPS